MSDSSSSVWLSSALAAADEGVDEVEALRRTNERLVAAVKDLEERAERHAAQHQRELAQLRAELERSASDRQQLERMVEEANAGHAAAQTSAQPLSAELEELRRRLAAEADATLRLREECERAKAKSVAAEAAAAAERERAKEARSEAETLKLQVQHVATTKEDDVAKLRAELAEAKRALRASQKDLEQARSESGNNTSPEEPRSPVPPVPELDLAGHPADQFASPHGQVLETPAASMSFAHHQMIPEQQQQGGTSRRRPRWRGESISATVTPRPSTEPETLPTPRRDSPLVPSQATFDAEPQVAKKTPRQSPKVSEPEAPAAAPSKATRLKASVPSKSLWLGLGLGLTLGLGAAPERSWWA